MRSLAFFLILGIGLLIFSAVTQAQEIESYNLTFQINDAVVDTSIQLLVTSKTELEFALPSDANDIKVILDNETINTTGQQLSLSFANATTIKFSSREFLDDENFLFNLVAPTQISWLNIRLVLPEGSVLKKPLSENSISAGSVFPKPKEALSDGQKIILIWEERNLSSGNEFSMFVSYRKQAEASPWLLLFMSLIGVGALYMLFFGRKRLHKPVKAEISHLKEDEEQIVNILKERDGNQIEQGTLRVITGYPKSSLSRLLSELEERKIIYREKRGKKNLIFLKK